MSDVVRRYYDESAEREWGRLIRDPYHMLEYIVTMHHIEKHLPEHGLILDAGGGPGRYTIELAKRGYDVVLLDLSPGSLEVARREIRNAGVGDRVVQMIEGTVTDLSEFEDESFDAVLCLGPLSHILEVGDQQKAAGELVRVAKKEVPLIISVISLYGVYMVVLKRLTDELLTRGIHRAAWHLGDLQGEGFTDAKFYHPSEVKELFEDKSVETLEMVTWRASQPARRGD